MTTSIVSISPTQSALQVNSVNSLVFNSAGDVQMASQNGGQLAGMRNRIINGDMRIFQRHTGAAIGAGFLADRWNVFQFAGTSLQQDRYTLSDTQRATIGTESKFGLSLFTGDTASAIKALQPIESVLTFSGNTVSVSFWAFATTGTCSIAFEVTQVFGAGGSPSANVVTTAVLSQTSVGTTPVKITATLAIPAVTGKTLGTNGNDYLGLLITKVAGSVNALVITNVQLEAGPVATPFENIPIGLQLSLCQRYFEVMGNQVTGGAFSASNLFFSNRFLVQKRAAPTMSVLTQGSWIGTGQANAIISTTFNNSSVDAYRIDNPSFNGSVTAGFAYALRDFVHTASAEL